MRGKIGAAHFEMIVSFVFFVGFVFFLFMILQPQDTSTLSGAVVAGLYDTFEESVHTNLSRVFLKAQYGGDGSCFNVSLPDFIFHYELGDGHSYVTKLEDDIDIDSGLMSGDLNVKNDSNNFRVAVSPEFTDEGVEDCEVLTEFDLGQPDERRVVSYGALVDMANRYDDEYDDLRNDLRVPAIFDFAIVSESLDIEMEPLLGIPDSVEVIAEDRIVEVLKDDGTLVNERLTLKIW
jgi:hypothetical protein